MTSRSPNSIDANARRERNTVPSPSQPDRSSPDSDGTNPPVEVPPVQEVPAQQVPVQQVPVQEDVVFLDERSTSGDTSSGGESSGAVTPSPVTQGPVTQGPVTQGPVTPGIETPSAGPPVARPPVARPPIGSTPVTIPRSEPPRHDSQHRDSRQQDSHRLESPQQPSPQQLSSHTVIPPIGTPSSASVEDTVATQQRVSMGSDAVGMHASDPSTGIEAEQVTDPSWVFRVVHWLGRATEWCLGLSALVVVLAVISAIPVIQLLALGYFLECGRRVAKTGRYWSAAVGIKKAARIGSVIVGTYLCLLPIQYVSSVWYASNLIDPASDTTQFLRGLQIVLTALIVPHILAAWYCGGLLRHFFWPLVAPFSMGLWTVRKMAASRAMRPVLNQTLGWVSPRLVEDICRAKPLTDWFLPAVLLKGIWTGSLYTQARDGLWQFVTGLRLPHYFWLGFRGFVGTIAWMFVPTMMLIGISVLPEGLAFLSGLMGVFLMSIVLVYVPFAQVHFAHENRLDALFDVGGMRKAFRGAPILHTIALAILLTFSLPLFLFKIEQIPPELLWMPGVMFLVLMWPARALVAWAYAKGIRRTKRRSFLLTWPCRLLQWPLAFAFTLFLLVSQYIAWNGSLSMLEHHVVLIPAPFFRLPF